MANWFIGQRVVCVNDSIPDWYGPDNGDHPQKGAIYTISAIINNPSGLGFQFVEISRSKSALALWKGNAAYHAWRFRPLDERTTDISIFTAMLHPKKVKEVA